MAAERGASSASGAPFNTRWMPSWVSRMASVKTSIGSVAIWKISARHCFICDTVLLRKM